MICTTCNEDKSVEDFAWKQQARGIRQTRCRLCHKAYTAQHYKENRQAYIDRARVHNKVNAPVYYARGKQIILEYLNSHPCVDCGETDIEVLEFDHIELVGQRYPRVSASMSPSKLQREFSLCEIRCANCHTRRTRKQMGWVRS